MATKEKVHLLRDDYKLSAAIDFGTTFCGVMYSLRKDFDEKNPLRIFAQQNNKGDTNTSLQEPTSVLLTPEKNFKAFGTEAEDTYAKLAVKKEHEDYLYFRRFKMTLHRQRELARYTEIEDIHGRKCKAITIFTMAIKCLKDRLRQNIKRREIGSISEQEIRWVITVPAIWSEAAKQYMREAANDAGIPSNQLTLALEPEVAAIFCKEVSMEKDSNDIILALNPGSRYMVLDLGGGTVDITLQEVLSDGNLKLLSSPSGGDWGGVGIDDAFYSLISKLVGIQVFEDFKTQHTHHWIHLQGDFEREKRKIKMEDEFSMMIQLPEVLINSHKQNSRISLKEVVQKTQWNTKLNLFESNVLELKQCILREFFDRNINDIIAHVEGIFRTSGVQGLNSILLVGGFAESSVVNTRITQRFKSKTVIVPNEAGSAVLKGAVIYGHNPNAISARVSPYTYGLHTRKPYNPKIHDERRKTKTADNKDVITNAFDKHIEVGEVVFIAKELSMHNFYVLDNNNPDVFWKVYRSSKKDPIYCDEEGCEYIGTLKINIKGRTPSGERRKLGVRMICRGTELEAEAQDEKTKDVFVATFDFLKRTIND